MFGRVLSVRKKLTRGQMSEQQELKLIEGKGIEGDHYNGGDLRQVLLLDKSTLEEFGYSPGTLREQITLDFPGLQSLAPGTRLKIGTAELEITGDCEPCLTMAKHVGEDGKSFVNKMMGRRGMLAKVSKSGRVMPADSVEMSE